MKRTRTQTQKVMNVLSSLTLLIFSTFCICPSEVNGQNIETDIFITIQNHYKKCLTTNKIGNENFFLTPLLPTINTSLDDTIKVSVELKKFILKEEWFSVSNKLLINDQTYWKPSMLCDSTLVSNDFPSSISKPIIYQDGTKAAVIGYWLKKGFQTVTFLTKIDNNWIINGDVNVGIYFKKSGKISEYKVPNKQ